MIKTHGRPVKPGQ